MQVLTEDLSAAKVHVQLQLQGKLDWRLRLPWVLIGLAAADEAVARQCARTAVATFEKDPREEVHHRLTWAWFCPESPLLPCLRQFAAGASRSSLSPLFVSTVATMRCVPIVETVIEQKHSKVTQQSMTGIGPVRVSLSNRLPLIEARIREEPGYLLELVSCFQDARKFKQAPAVMGFEEHPLMQNAPKKEYSLGPGVVADHLQVHDG